MNDDGRNHRTASSSSSPVALGFVIGDDLPLPAWARQRACACHAGANRLACAQHGRRWFTGLAVASAVGLSACGKKEAPAPGTQEGVGQDVGKSSVFVKAVPPEQLEQAAEMQFRQMSKEAQQKNQLAPRDHPQVVRLRTIAERIIPFAPPWNARARDWRWDVQLFGSNQVNAFCMPGGKIAFYWGILSKLQLTDDEVAMIMGHEVAHALREHARERMGKQAATRVGANVVSSILGLGQLGDLAVGMGAQLLSLKFSRDDETEADLVGLELASRAGYNPAAGVTLWQKMLEANKGAPPEFMSTHPAGESRIQDIKKVLPKVEPLYARAPRPEQTFGPPRPTKS